MPLSNESSIINDPAANADAAGILDDFVEWWHQRVVWRVYGKPNKACSHCPAPNFVKTVWLASEWEIISNNLITSFMATPSMSSDDAMHSSIDVMTFNDDDTSRLKSAMFVTSFDVIFTSSSCDCIAVADDLSGLWRWQIVQHGGDLLETFDDWMLLGWSHDDSEVVCWRLVVSVTSVTLLVGVARASVVMIAGRFSVGFQIAWRCLPASLTRRRDVVLCVLLVAGADEAASGRSVMWLSGVMLMHLSSLCLRGTAMDFARVAVSVCKMTPVNWPRSLLSTLLRRIATSSFWRLTSISAALSSSVGTVGRTRFLDVTWSHVLTLFTAAQHIATHLCVMTAHLYFIFSVTLWHVSLTLLSVSLFTDCSASAHCNPEGVEREWQKHDVSFRLHPARGRFQPPPSPVVDILTADDPTYTAAHSWRSCVSGGWKPPLEQSAPDVASPPTLTVFRNRLETSLFSPSFSF